MPNIPPQIHPEVHSVVFQKADKNTKIFLASFEITHGLHSLKKWQSDDELQLVIPKICCYHLFKV